MSDRLAVLRLRAEDGTDWNVVAVLAGPAIGEFGIERDLDELLESGAALAAITIVEKDPDHG